MARRKAAAEITAEALVLDVPAPDEGIKDGGFLPEQAEDVELPVEPEPESAEPAKPENEHVDIGNWRAEYWRGRPIWRHKRSGFTLFNRQEVWRQRNAK